MLEEENKVDEEHERRLYYDIYKDESELPFKSDFDEFVSASQKCFE